MSDEKKSSGFDLEKAWEDTKDEYSYGTTAGKVGATAALLGKGLFNAGLSFGKHLMNTTKEAVELSKDYDNEDESFLRKKQQDGTAVEKMAANAALKRQREQG